MQLGKLTNAALAVAATGALAIASPALARDHDDDRDRDNFLERLGNVLTETNTPCFAWSLIPNHLHLLLRTGNIPIATIMRRLLTGYAVTFNRRYRRHGHLFQNRYKSILCQEDLYLLELVRYIHLNPLRSKIVKDIICIFS